MPHPHPVQIGRRTRMSFSQITEVAELPNLIEIQLESYEWFLREGLREVFEEVFPIEDYTGNIKLEFLDYFIEETPKYDVEESKERDVTYSAPLKVRVRLTVPDEDGSKIIKNESGEPVFLGDFPLMTDKGTFIISLLRAGAAFVPDVASVLLGLAGLCWVAAFGLLCWRIAPVLWRVRPDGLWGCQG